MGAAVALGRRHDRFFPKAIDPKLTIEQNPQQCITQIALERSASSNQAQPLVTCTVHCRNAFHQDGPKPECENPQFFDIHHELPAIIRSPYPPNMAFSATCLHPVLYTDKVALSLHFINKTNITISRAAFVTAPRWTDERRI